MKIAVTSSGHIPSQYAHSINVVKHANAFVKLGYSVELLSVKRFYENEFIKEIDDIFNFYGINRLPITFFKDKSIFYFQDKKPFRVLIKILKKFLPEKIKEISDPEKQISHYIKNNNFDLCYSRNFKLTKYNIENKIPTIMETHSPDPEKKRDLMDVLKFSNSEYFKGIVTIHQKLKDNFVRLGVPEKKILIQEDAVDLEIFDQISDDAEKNRNNLHISIKKKIVMYCGSLKPGKGIHLILQTAKKLELNNDILFYIVGGSKIEIDFWKNYNDQKYRNVVFTGFIHGSQIPQFLKSADILFMPYDKNEKNKVMDINTTSPIKLFEYMASKKPILTSKIQVIEKILEDKLSAIILENNYEKGIEELLSNKKLCQKISENAYAQSKNYTYKKRCEKILDALF
tara:strand:+ start:672 stop:1871 length:1200 start_codon:yes stop_codon:yes gene_type:complete